MTNNSEKIIEVKDLTVGYDNVSILDNLNFNINKGEVFAILGGSGCGKSTILKHMIGLYQPMQGDILINGTSIVTASENLKHDLTKQFGVLYQSGALFSSLTLEENISLPLEEFTDLPKPLIKSIAKVKLSLVGLEGFEHYSPFEISGGMKKTSRACSCNGTRPRYPFFRRTVSRP